MPLFLLCVFIVIIFFGGNSICTTGLHPFHRCLNFKFFLLCNLISSTQLRGLCSPLIGAKKVFLICFVCFCFNGSKTLILGLHTLNEVFSRPPTGRKLQPSFMHTPFLHDLFINHVLNSIYMVQLIGFMHLQILFLSLH